MIDGDTTTGGTSRTWKVARALIPALLLAMALGHGVTLMQTHGWPARVVLNVSASMPRGLWHIEQGRRAAEWAPGDVLAARAPARARALGCVKGRQLLLKQVVAAPGQTVCLDGRQITVGTPARPYGRAPQGEELPRPAWQGCRVVGDGELFVATPHARSCDSRYWGLLDTDQVLGRARPVLTFHEEE